MLTLRPAAERGHTQLDWLDSRHSFSFDQYYDSRHMSFGHLRVINEDRIAAGGGFGTHPHRDMEIITYVVEGQLEHRDSLGNGSIISAGEIQKMSAGSGILHSEYNASKESPVHLLQIWIVPDKLKIKPNYEQKQFRLNPGELTLLGSPGGRGLVSIQQNVKLFALSLKPGILLKHSPAPGAKIWIQIVKGACTVNARDLHAGDGAALNGKDDIAISTEEHCELLVFEMLA